MSIKFPESKRLELTNKYIILFQLFFFLLLGIIHLRNSGITYENYLGNVPNVVSFIFLLGTVPLLQFIFQSRYSALTDLVIVAIYTIFLSYLLLYEKEVLFKAAFMMPVIFMGLKFGIRMASLVAIISSFALFVISYANGFVSIDADIMFSGINFLLAWLLGKMTETEYHIRTELQEEIRERRRIEKMLEDQLVFLQRLIDTIPNPIFLRNDSAFLRCNTAFEQFFGLSKKEISCMKDDDFAGTFGVIGSPVLQKSEKRNFETTLTDAQGNIRDVMINKASFLNEKNESAGTVGIIVDITEQKKFQREMVRTDRLNLVGEMAAGIAHEIRNPITTVKGFLQIFSTKKELAKYGEDIELMISELDRANKIISEYLSLAKDRVIDLKITNLNSIVQAVYPLIQADAIFYDKQINLKLEKIPDLLLDESEIRQLLLNLCRNGLEAMESGGILTVGTYQKGKNVVLSVKDQGKGINPLLINKIGTPFVTDKEKGTGLGLSVCYSIAARHNAVMTFNTGSQGTTFKIKFSAPGEFRESRVRS